MVAFVIAIALQENNFLNKCHHFSFFFLPVFFQVIRVLHLPCVSYIFMTFLATSRTAEFHFCFGRYWCDHGRQTWKLTQTHTRSVLRRQTQSRLRVLCGESRAYQVFDGTRVALYSYRKDHKNKLKWVSQAMLHCVKCCCIDYR